MLIHYNHTFIVGAVWTGLCQIFLRYIIILWLTGTNSLWTVKKITAQIGGSVTIPCHYHRLHKDLPKFWCKGKIWVACLTMRSTNQEKRTGISFYNSPDELVTTMTMTNLLGSDSNRYWCAVKKPGSNARTNLELTVTEGKCYWDALASMRPKWFQEYKWFCHLIVFRHSRPVSGQQ